MRILFAASLSITLLLCSCASRAQSRPHGVLPKEMSILELKTRRLGGINPDCNRNGIADSLDIARRTAWDVNRNNVIDLCDSDVELAKHFSDWKGLSSIADTSYFRAEFVPNGSVAIHYTVPPGGARVRLVVLGSDSVSTGVTIVSGWKKSGAFWIPWNREADHLPPGLYLLKLTVARREYVHPIQWGALHSH